MSIEKFNVVDSDTVLELEAEKLDKDIAFYDVRNYPFDVYGFYNYKEEPHFRRLPDDVAQRVSPGVAGLSLRTAGGRVRFSTTSNFVTISAVMPFVKRKSSFSLNGSAGFDLYLDTPNIGGSGMGDSKYWRTYSVPYDMVGGYTSTITFPDSKLRYFTINFPTYSSVKDLYIGLAKDAVVGEGMKYSPIDPIVYYGSSITQGGCVSRPGNTYQSIISRRLGIDFLNLGFSGSALAEDAIVEYMASLKMSAFVAAYDHNNTVEGLRDTHYNLYRRIRDAHPDMPFIMISRADFDSKYNDSILRREIIHNTYMRARGEGDTNVYFIDGAGVFRGRYEDACTVDGVHFNDIGCALTADAIEAELRRGFQIKPY